MHMQCCTILVADFDRFVRDDLFDLLHSQFSIVFAATARDTLETVNQQKPELVLLDIKFPDSNDLSIVERIKHDVPDTEVLILTTQAGDNSFITSAIKMGAFDCVAKPFIPEELRNRVMNAHDLCQLRRSNKIMTAKLRLRGGAGNLIQQLRCNRRRSP